MTGRPVILTILPYILFLFSINHTAYARGYLQGYNKNIDTILHKMRVAAGFYEKNTPNFEAEMYIKGNLDVKKRNIIIKGLPYLKKLDKNKDKYFFELSSNFSHTYPNIYNQTFNAVKSNYKAARQYIENTVLPYIHGNVYSPYLYGTIYSPIAPKSKKYYKYAIESFWHSEGITYYKINFTPKLRSYQLVSGYIIINTNNWSIRELFLKGRTEFIHFSNYIEMGEIGSLSEFLTQSSTIAIDFRLLGNKISGEYYSYINYLDTSPPEPADSKRKGKYDLTLLYNVNFNKATFNKKVSFDSIRPVPLTPQEEEITRRTQMEQDSLARDTTTTRKNGFVSVGKFLISDYSLNMKDYGSIEFSPLISPVLFNYSSSNGISYAQRLRYTKLFKGDRLFFIEPKIGYNFKEKELYWYVRGNLDYSPKRNASVFFDIGHGYNIGTDKIINDLKALPDTIFDYTSLHLYDFKVGYLRFGHRIEVANGFNISAILALHQYKEIKKSDFKILKGNSEYLEQALQIARRKYTDFVPELQLTWTPHQYYYMDGNRKVYLYSKYPTFSLNWAYAIKGVLNSTTTYHRIEFDMQHQIKLGLTKKISYRFGAGGFFNYSNLYFADFLNFQRNNLPEGWDDEIGGTFQLLSSNKYYGITRYVRGHIKFDAPFLIIPALFKKLPFIMKERIYCNVLYVNTLKPYIELGYGIGTRLFNVGIFFGGEVNKFDLIGFKTTFELSHF